MALPDKYSFIAIEGNIGAGKTSLAERIASEYNATIILEQFEDNPFLPKFYEDQAKYAFPLELSFMASRYQQLKDPLSERDIFKPFTVADYFITKSLIFARSTLDGDELALFSRLFNIIISSLPRPDLLVYLYADIDRLQSNIRKRGRDYEQNIQSAYLEKIQHGYLDYLKQINHTPVLIIDTNKLDFVNNGQDYENVIDMISAEYSNGLHLLNVE